MTDNTHDERDEELDTLTDRERTAMEALHQYGSHKQDCALRTSDRHAQFHTCTCGFTDVLRKLGGVVS